MVSGVAVYNIQVLYFIEVMFGCISRIYTRYARIESTTQDSGQAGIFESFLVCPLPAVLVFSFVQRFVIGRVEIADTVCQTGIHDVEVLIGQSQIYYQVRFEGVEQADEFFHVVCIDLCCLYLYILNIGGDLVALAFRAAGNHDIGKDIRVHRDLLNSNGTNAPCTNN